MRLSIDIRSGAALTNDEKTAREAVSVLEQALGPEHPKVGSALGILSQTLRFQNKAAEALPVAERTLDVLTRALGEDHPTVAGSSTPTPPGACGW